MAPKTLPVQALSGIRVVAFEQVLSGPFGTCLLADMGAEVIKVERPGVGDVIRQWDSVVRGLSSGYVWLNRNKRSLAVDVKKEAGREILHRLSAKADIFFENYAPGVAERLGLGYEKLSQSNPRLIYCSLSGYGQDGPFSVVTAYDLRIQGEAGIIATTGYPDKPAKAGIAIADIAAGMYAALGILFALYQREKSGPGPIILVLLFYKGDQANRNDPARERFSRLSLPAPCGSPVSLRTSRNADLPTDPDVRSRRGRTLSNPVPWRRQDSHTARCARDKDRRG